MRLTTSWKLRPAAVALAALLAAPQAFAQAAPSCTGSDLLAKAQAEQPEKYAAFETKAKAVPNAEGLLWRISPKAGPASHLFGTMHTTEPDLVALAGPVGTALGEAKTVAVELADANGAAAQAEMVAYVTRYGVDFSGKGLEGFTEEQVAEVKRRLGDAGMPASVATMLKPWFLALTLEISACELKKMSDGKPTVDAAVEKTGRERGAEIVGLESVGEQLKAVSTISEETAKRMIRDSVENTRSGEDLQATTLGLYRARRVGWYFAMDRETFGSTLDVSSYQDFLEGVVDRRNKLMLERSKALIDKGGAFIAVGALHLPGANGLVELLRAQGYSVEKVW